MRPCDVSKVLGEYDADALNQLDKQTREMVRAVEETGLMGELTIKLKFKKNGDNSVIVASEVKAKVPRKPAGARVMFFAYDDMNHATGELAVTPHKQEPLFRGENITPIKKGN